MATVFNRHRIEGFDDVGILWEHIVLNEIQAQPQTQRVNYWHNKRGNIDFVWEMNGFIPVRYFRPSRFNSRFDLGRHG